MSARAAPASRPRRILIVHARYQQAGGEDTVVSAERRLLGEAGHEVVLLEASNESIVGLGRTLAAGVGAVYSLSGRRHMARAIAEHAPDVVHVHNTFPVLSPSVFDACRAARVPVVQTLHNYRLVCPNGLLFRDGRPCHDCVDRPVPWPAVQHGCYRGSRAASAASAAMVAVHRQIGTYRDRVDAIIALSRFQRDLVLRAGLAPDKIFVKPTGLPDPGPAEGGPGDYALYLGRLSTEKGIAKLIDAYGADGPAVPLRVAGDGPLRADLEQRVAVRGAGDRVTFLGWLDRAEIVRQVRGARFLVFPTECYEALPLAPIEVAACGRPSVASRIGAVPEVVVDGETGWLIDGGPGEWRLALERAWSDPGEALRRGAAARARFLAVFSEARSAAALEAIYDRVCARRPG